MIVLVKIAALLNQSEISKSHKPTEKKKKLLHFDTVIQEIVSLNVCMYIFVLKFQFNA